MTSTFFFFNDTATTEIYTLSLHDALPIWQRELHRHRELAARARELPVVIVRAVRTRADRKSTRLNSSHSQISYAVFCLKKKKTSTVKLTACPQNAAHTKPSLMRTSSYDLH